MGSYGSQFLHLLAKSRWILFCWAWWSQSVWKVLIVVLMYPKSSGSQLQGSFQVLCSTFVCILWEVFMQIILPVLFLRFLTFKYEKVWGSGTYLVFSFYIICMCVPVRYVQHIRAGTWRAQRYRWLWVTYLIWVLGTKLGPLEKQQALLPPNLPNQPLWAVFNRLLFLLCYYRYPWYILKIDLSSDT